jgi:glycosyltransferase involved in cell wall biosynthesis
MAKKNHGKGRNNKKNKKKLTNRDKLQNNVHNLPFVSVCTPTFNRRPFIPFAIQNYLTQDYPQEKMEWIVLDDGTDKVGDLFEGIPGVQYFAFDEKMTLGKKRNTMHDKAKGDIIVYMDDDDYYPPERVSHAVSMLTRNKNALCSGSSKLYIWYNKHQKTYQFGPYGKTHATAGTFAFKKELLLQTRYNEESSLAEEKEFLKNYTIPFVQLDPMKTILVFSHSQNTCDKNKFITDPLPKYVKETSLTINDFVSKERENAKEFIENVEKVIEDYELGTHKYKPDVVAQLERMKKDREKIEKEMKDKSQNIQIMRKDNNGNNVVLTQQEITQLVQVQQQQLKQFKLFTETLQKQVTEKDELIRSLQEKLRALQQNESQNIELHIEEHPQESTADESKENEDINDEVTSNMNTESNSNQDTSTENTDSNEKQTTVLKELMEENT